MQDIDKAMIGKRGTEWLSSAARLQIQNAQRNTQYEAMMHDRIKQMAVEAGIDLDPHGGIAKAYPVNLERFAQAVARECISCGNACGGAGVELMIERIRARFGLGE